MPKLNELFGMRERRYKPDGSRWPELLGIELELERVKNLREVAYWTQHQDGSLRDGIELVLDQPYAGITLEAALHEYYAARLECDNTARTSTHIHINMTDSTLDCLRSMTMIMYMIEDPLFSAVGESRKWAGYAMPLSDMEPRRLSQLLASNEMDVVVNNVAPGRNQERYYGFNTAAMRKHGTVEFRYYPGGPTREELENWMDLAVQVKKAGTALTPTQLTDRLVDADAVVEFLGEFFSDYWVNTLLRHVDAGYILTKFNEVAALAFEQELLERREALVFLTDPFLSYVKRHLLAEAGREYIDGIKTAFEVLSIGDWWYHLRRAEELDYAATGVARPKNSAKTKKFTIGGLDHDVYIGTEPARGAFIDPFGGAPPVRLERPRPAVNWDVPPPPYVPHDDYDETATDDEE